MTLQINTTHAIFLISLPATDEVELQNYVAVKFLSIKKEWSMNSVVFKSIPWVPKNANFYTYLSLVNQQKDTESMY